MLSILASPLRAEDDPVLFAAYNLKNYLKMERRVKGEVVENAPKPESEIDAVVAIIAQIRPHLLGLVEIGNEGDLMDLQTRLKAAGVDLPHRALAISFDDDRRVALLSQFPIIETNHQIDLTYLMNAKRMTFKRGVLDATVKIRPDYDLRLLGTHLKSKREVEDGDQSLMRRNEAHLLRRHAEDILNKAPETNLLLFGDYNDTRNEAPIDAIQGSFGTDTYLKDIPIKDAQGEKWTYYWSFADQYSRFDYLFASKALLPEVIVKQSYIASHPDWFKASDHRPVVLAIRPVNE